MISKGNIAKNLPFTADDSRLKKYSARLIAIWQIKMAADSFEITIGNVGQSSK